MSSVPMAAMRARSAIAVVVEWGGFLGVGTREALVPIERIKLGDGDQCAELTMTKEELEALLGYDRD